MEVEHVESVVDTEDRTLRTRIVRNEKPGEKGPVIRVLVALPGPFRSKVEVPFPVFRQIDKRTGAITGYEATFPGGGFPALEPARQSVIGQNGTRYYLSDADEEGRDIADRLLAQVRHVALTYLASKGKGPSEGTITL